MTDTSFTCPDCGKVRYFTKAKAKTAIRQHRGRIGRLNAYRCGEFWHIGHLPPAVIAGHVSRDQIVVHRQKETP